MAKVVITEPAGKATDEEVKTKLTAALANPDSAAEFASFVAENGGIFVFKETSLLDELTTVMQGTNKKKGVERTAACSIVNEMAKAMKAPAEPYLSSFIGVMLQLLADKAGKAVGAAAEVAVTTLVDSLSNQGKKMIALPQLLSVLVPESKYQTTAFAFSLVTKIAKEAPEELGSASPEVVPCIGPFLNDAKASVAQNANACIVAICDSIDNTDVQPLVPALISALKNHSEVEDCIFKLASTTFVQQVERTALAITVPLLKRGFQTRKTPVMRMCARIIENMAKLVERKSDIEPFLPTLMPALQRAADEVSDPEARGVCASAVEVLDARSKGVGMQPEPESAEMEKIKATLWTCIDKTDKVGDFFERTASFISLCCVALVDAKDMEVEAWKANVSEYVEQFVESGDIDALVAEFAKKCEAFVQVKDEEEEEEDAEQLCDCKFSLAYGNKVLFNNTRMKLNRGLRYGLIGGNESGKTTLMRSIANGQVEGFPSPDEVRTVFVEADILGELSHLNIIDYVYQDEKIQAYNIPREEIENVLASVGFTNIMISGGVSHLSGGWRMKLALARAMLQKADILLMDEPTNHLDVVNVKWVESYLMGLKNVTAIIVSHDSGLLERVCSNIIHIDALKLKQYKGNLSEFVKKVPAAKSFFELKSTKIHFSFPQPGILEGITSKGKAIMKMDGVEFTYPGVHRPQVSGVTIRIALASRVACIGPNGAGKSTIIKLLTGELVPDVGTVWKHPNCRVAYVAQHAFHHIENHLELTPNQYIQWRYQYGDDKEALVKSSMVVTDDELKAMKQPIQYTWKSEDGLKTFTDKLVIKDMLGSRRTVKGTKADYEYEVSFENKPTQFTAWLPTEKLEGAGWNKHLKAVDEKVAARAAAYETPLTSSNVEKHLENTGLDKEYGTHTRIGALSGGQKVKVVLAAAMWNHPHIVILDEPTNYLDRESLGALAEAIQGFDGGVVLISHNSEFTKAVCPETWVMSPATETEPGKLDVQGDADWMKEALKEKIEVKQIDEMIDGFGNTVKIKPQKKKTMSRAEKKKLERKRAAQKRNGEYFVGINGSDDEDF
ncbi:hypothetical protein NDN08_003245 [Rhodosorus marinus]|uniref:Probable ATP-dependent transporter ycf16 n=1 Tax=Rhodosorus marinus TaxID=101924 RepID=A0AAV8V083_9RHOD|nr:hypothetical protein NDN08_003245 [Rhodosorus marinus]